MKSCRDKNEGACTLVGSRASLVTRGLSYDYSREGER